MFSRLAVVFWDTLCFHYFHLSFIEYFDTLVTVFMLKKVLIAKGALVDTVSFEDRTALMAAARVGHLAVVEVRC